VHLLRGKLEQHELVNRSLRIHYPLFILQAGGVLSTIVHPLAPFIISGLGLTIASLFYYNHLLLIIFISIGLIKGWIIDAIPLFQTVDLTLLISVLVLIVILWELSNPEVRTRFLAHQYYFAAFCLWVLWLLCTSVYAPRVDWALEKGLRFALFGFTLFMAPLVMFKSKKEGMNFLKILIAVGFIGALVLVTQMLYLAATGSFVELTTRLVLFTSNPIQTARFMSVCAVLMGIMMAFSEKRKFIFGLSMLVFVIAALSTGSRGPVLSLFVTLITLGIIVGGNLRKQVGILFLVGILVVVIALLTMPENLTARYNVFASSELVVTRKGLVVFSTISSRWTLWSNALELWIRDIPHFLFGSGAGGYAALFPWRDFRYPHNLFLEILAEFGIIGLVFFLSHAVLAVINVVRHFRKRYSQPEVLWLGATLTVFFSAMFSGDINDNRLIWFFLSGLLAAIHSGNSESRFSKTELDLPTVIN